MHWCADAVMLLYSHVFYHTCWPNEIHGLHCLSCNMLPRPLAWQDPTVCAQLALICCCCTGLHSLPVKACIGAPDNHLGSYTYKTALLGVPLLDFAHAVL